MGTWARALDNLVWCCSGSDAHVHLRLYFSSFSSCCLHLKLSWLCYFHKKEFTNLSSYPPVHQTYSSDWDIWSWKNIHKRNCWGHGFHQWGFFFSCFLTLLVVYCEDGKLTSDIANCKCRGLSSFHCQTQPHILNVLLNKHIPGLRWAV